MANIVPGTTTAQEAADIINNDRAKVGGDSSQDFAAKDITAHGFHNLTNGNNFYFAKGYENSSNLDINYAETINPISTYTFWNGQLGKAGLIAASFLPFTGCHVIPNEGQNFKIGELVCIEAIESKDEKQPDWRGRYAKKGENGIFGIVFDEYEESIMEDDGLDEDGNPKQKQSGVNKFYSIACLGDMKVFCNGENGNIEYGDELCASSKNGVAMKFTGKWEDRKQICGKAGRSHTFESDEVVLIDTAKE